MILADEILYGLYYSEKYRNTLLSELLAQERQGEDTCVLESKYIVLGEWIRIMRGYYVSAFNEQGEPITPDYECLTQEQALQLLANLKLARGNNKYPVPTIFELGVWLDSAGYFDDGLTWYDEINVS